MTGRWGKRCEKQRQVESENRVRLRMMTSHGANESERRGRCRGRGRRVLCVSRIGRTRIPIETRRARGYMCDVSASMCSSVFRRVARSETDGERDAGYPCVFRERACAREGGHSRVLRDIVRDTKRSHFRDRRHALTMPIGRKGSLIALAILRASPPRTEAAESGDERVKREKKGSASCTRAIVHPCVHERTCACADAEETCPTSLVSRQ